jgi:hypothetical protein
VTGGTGRNAIWARGGAHVRPATATAVFSSRQCFDTSAQFVGSDGQIECQFAANSSFGCSAKNQLKCGGFLSRKPKVVVFRKFRHQCGGFMLFTHGNYDGLNKPPIFDLYLGTNYKHDANLGDAR